MTSLNLGINEKKDSQILIENLQELSQSEVDNFILNFVNSNEPGWQRFIKGAYNHPLTWWVGIFQLQMQMGLWGHQRRASANIRANMLWQVTKSLREVPNKKSSHILGSIIKYNIKYRKSDISGRLVGGAFTNYASTGGRLGKSIGGKIKYPINLTNFMLASYGAAIKSIATGNKSLESVIQSVLTGRPETLPVGILKNMSMSYSKEELKLLSSSEIALAEVMSLSRSSPAPVPIKEFCLRPENINLDGLCK